ncbi:hypothetical protein GCM10007887_02060 [Methylobacterium haplocladii]|uniref:N-acetyltransferase domain-containing protein n=1 Tax=Methylobacterium haplocladii TaxID=1176176 RepID=A0A512IJC8_9HYPH|nr:acyl-CoA acyltransferase [Methylobacterium haplocladii]GEO97816.1 hypothetical protein MHA02_02040 [Methylobacterium haplocladii]GLS57551.1 hypothetical protein GCM10007887_02060 [Methylobacterium haplocladii]
MRCRRVGPADIDALGLLLTQGFPARSLVDWRRSLTQLRAWTEAERLPGLGFVLADGDALVGCLLTLYGAGGTRCNMSSWYVEEGYRRFGTMLVSAALRDRSITYVNISSERHTRPIIEAQGFRRYTEGVMLAAPLASLAGLGRATISAGRPGADVTVDPAEAALMEHHAALGCITFWCVADGRAYPFVVARRLIKGRLPIAQIVYCAEALDWRRLSHAVGRALARHGLFLLLLDAQGAVPGLPGRFLAGRMPKYARGPVTPRCGDLAYTEAAVIGT